MLNAQELDGASTMPIAGLGCRALTRHRDSRGDLTEVYRNEWKLADTHPVQWNIVHSAANALRGVHLHRRHRDALTVVEGEMLLGLQDLRPDSETSGTALLLALSAAQPAMVTIPVGVAHGFYFPEPAVHLYGVDIAFDGSDEFGCQWNDEGVAIEWPCSDPILSERDQTAGTLAEMVEAAGFAR
ncbi:MAG: dTDP-4-dehydrorhamnose 3,5-epimerase family protein [Phycisphaerales bacterium]